MTLKAREIIRPGDVNMTFYFNNKNQPEKRMPQQVNKPITDSTVKFTDEPVSTSKNISNQPKKTQEVNRKNKTEQKHLKKKNRKICKEVLKRLSSQKFKRELHQLNQEYKSKDKNDTDDSED